MGRMRFYPVALTQGDATMPLEFIRISNNAASTSNISYFPSQFAQLGTISGTNGINQTNFHSTISSVSDSTGTTLWTFDVDMEDPSPNNQQQITLADEHYLQLVRKSITYELLPYHDFYHASDTVSDTYASNLQDYAPVDNFNFRPFVFRHSYKWYPYYLDAINNSGITTTVAAIAYANYFPWTPSQELLARFRGHFFSTVSGPMYRNDTYRRAGLVDNLFGAALIPTDGSFEFDNNPITHKSIINSNNKTDLNSHQIIQPCDHSLNIMSRIAVDNPDQQPYYDLVMHWLLQDAITRSLA